MKIALSIAGSDSGGGAGIQADLKTFEELRVFGTSVITAITAQNTLGVSHIYEVSLQSIEEQLKAVLSDLKPNAIKTGMLFDSKIINLVYENLKNQNIPLVCDCVMVAKGGAKLLKDYAINALICKLIPICELITPNIPEAEIISNFKIKDEKDMIKAGLNIQKIGVKSVLMKGGHLSSNDAFDILIDEDKIYKLTSPRIDTKNTHGTGCTYSAAITAGLADGLNMLKSVIRAKAFVYEAIKNDLHLGSGHGPTNHFAYAKNGQNSSEIKVENL